MKNIILSFDYELFLGPNSGTVTNCLIKPTDQLLRVLKKHSAKAIFFIDTAFMLKLYKLKSKYLNLEKDYERIKNQISKIHSDGHYLYHHLHPHWEDAVYSEEHNTWNLSNHKNYRFHDCEDFKQNELFEFSSNFLMSITKNNPPNQGFRAGGLQILPFEAFISYFNKYKICYDFSCVRTNSVETYYKFSKTPKTKTNNGLFKEFLITTIEIRYLNKVLNSLIYRLNSLGDKIMGDGIGKHYIPYNDISKSSVNKLKSLISMQMIHSLEILNPITNKIVINQLKTQDYMHFLSHPKLLSKYTISQFDFLLQKISMLFEVEFDFKKFK